MLAHPRFQAENKSQITAAKGRRLSENSVLQTRVAIRYRRDSHLINCLPANTRVRELELHLGCPLDSEKTFRALVDWLSMRGDKCALILSLKRCIGDVGQLTMEGRASILSSSATKLNLKKLEIYQLDEHTLRDALMTNISSLVTEETRVQLTGLSLRTIRRRVLPLVQRITNLSLPVYWIDSDSTDINELFESILSQQNNRKLELHFVGVPSPEQIDCLVDCLNRYQGQDGATLNVISLDLHSNVHTGRRFIASLRRMPSRFPVALRLGIVGFGNSDTDEALLQSLLSLPSLKSLRLDSIRNGDMSRWVNMIEGLCHGRLHTLKLETKKAFTAHCLTRFLHSSDLQVLHLNVNQSANGLVDAAHAMADVLPTMTRLKDFSFCQFGLAYCPEFEERITNEQDHDNHLTSSKSYHLPTYIAYDALYTAVCDHSPSITTCELPEFTEWHRDRLAFALKTRMICVEKLLASNATPLSLLPSALSLLSEGHWYDVMAHIVRQKSDLLIAPTGGRTKHPKSCES